MTEQGRPRTPRQGWIGRYARLIMTQKGVGPTAVATATGVGRSTVQNYLAHRAYPPPAWRIKLAKFLECSLADLHQKGWKNPWD